MFRTLNCFGHFLTFLSAISWCVLIFAFASLAGIPVVNTSVAIKLKTCALPAGIKQYQSIIKKKR